MSGSHTPGPWGVSRLDGGEQYNILDSSDQPDANVVATARFHDDSPGETLSNARLIAAAPDLLAALRDVLRIAKAASLGVSGNAPRLARAEAAIAKATGSAP